MDDKSKEEARKKELGCEVGREEDEMVGRKELGFMDVRKQSMQTD